MDGGRTLEAGEGPDVLLAQLIELVQPHSEEDIQQIWDHVMQHDSTLSWLEPASLEKALEAAHAGHWRLCAYLAARCFKDWKERHGSEAAAAKLGEVDERCHRTLWLAVADAVLVDIPPGQERLRVLLDHEHEPRLISTDQLESEIVPADGRVVLRVNKSPVVGQLVQKDHTYGCAESFNPGETLELSQLMWQKRLRPSTSTSSPQRFDVESRRSAPPWSPRNEMSRSSKSSHGSTPSNSRKSIRCLQMSEEERLRLHQLLVSNSLNQAQEEGGEHDWGTGTPSAHVSGTWYHVLAYPLFGDVTKALLRPAARCWAAAQKEKASSFTQRRGETLMAECAKACQWALVEVLLRSGVPLPDLHREFEKVCGASDATRRLWRKDWLHAIGSAGPTPLLELAAAEDPATLGKLLNALEAQKPSGVESYQLPDLVGGPGGRGPEPLILRAAEVRRWAVVAVLLSSRLPVAAQQFLASPLVVYCPQGLVFQAEIKAQEERFTEPAVKKTWPLDASPTDQLAEYFHRRHISTVLDSSAPGNWQSEGPWLCNEETEVWNELHYLGETGAEAVVLFLLLSKNECSLLSSMPAALKTLNLQGKDASLTPCKAAGWLPVFCPRNFLQVCESSETGFSFAPAANCLPTARAVASCPLRVRVQSSCCEANLEDFDFCLGSSCVHAKGEADGKVVEVRAGQHRLWSPTLGLEPRTIQVAPKPVAEGTDETVDGDEEEEVGGQTEVLKSPGFLFFYVITVEETEYLMLTGKLQNIPEEAQDFVGKAFFEQKVIPIRSRFEPFVLPEVFEPSSASQLNGRGRPTSRVPCQEILRNMALTNSDGQQVELSGHALEYLEYEEDPCKVNLLRSAAPLRLGPLPKSLGTFRASQSRTGRREKAATRRSRSNTGGRKSQGGYVYPRLNDVYFWP